MVLVGSHLWHGVGSGFQSLGLDHPRWTPIVMMGGKLLAVLIAGGFIVIAIWAHLAGARS
jgi:succinate dehydrogenase / fumarate reductase cytochrome b subunit